MNNTFITGNKFKSLCDDYVDIDKHYIDISKKPKTIFVKTDYIPAFYKKIMPLIDYNFSLVTHNSDLHINERYSVIYEDKIVLLKKEIDRLNEEVQVLNMELMKAKANVIS